MQDLLYVGDRETKDQLEAKLKKEFPKAKINSTWDDIHEYRLELEMDDKNREDYWRYLIKESDIRISFAANIIGMDKTHEHYKTLLDILKEAVANKN